MRNFKDKIAFITGAASGIGYQLALQLADQGCHLFLVDVNKPGLDALRQQLDEHKVRIWTHECDLTDATSVDAVCEKTLQLTGGIDLLINNAGVAYYGPTDRMTQAQWDWLMAINLLAPIRITRQLLPSLLSRPDTHLVSMCSISGLVAGGRFAAYHTSKFGLIGFTEAIRAEYGRRGLGVTSICPGPVLTQLYSASQSDSRDKEVPSPPAWLSTTPERVAAVTIKSIRRNKRQVLITPMAHGLFQMKRFMPGLIDFANQFSRKKKKRQAALLFAMEQQALQVPAANAVEDRISPTPPLSSAYRSEEPQNRAA